MAIFRNIFPLLPKYTGPYQVGSLELEVPLEGTKEWPITETVSETILVRLFYPTDDDDGVRRSSPTWLPQPSREYARGYADFLKQPVLPTSLAISLAVYHTTIPASENAPPLRLDPDARLPVMIFSHGLGGSRNVYSQYCGSMASYGIFVAAIEHRDGSAPNSVVNAGTKEQYTIPYRRITEYSERTKHLRTSQLAQRTFEVSKLVALLRDINHGNGKSFKINEDKKKHIDLFKGLLHTEKGQFIMAGHSFGAATTVAACKDKENDDAGYPLKDEFRAAIMLDIWMMVLHSCGYS
jgi:platelet-activating factor acetylhydrolase